MIKDFRFSEKENWLKVLVQDFKASVDEAIHIRGRAHIALSGGSTPQSFYLRLNKESLPWDRMEWWLGDERWVPPTDSLSNERMVRETLGCRHAHFEASFHSWHLAKEPEKAASLYENQLQKHLGTPPVFDLVLLGIGADGHTASLFPNTPALEEKHRYAMANHVPQLNTTRLTITFPVLDAARQIWFLAQGKEKTSIVNQLLKRNADIPAARVQNSQQKLYWIL